MSDDLAGQQDVVASAFVENGFFEGFGKPLKVIGGALVLCLVIAWISAAIGFDIARSWHPRCGYASAQETCVSGNSLFVPWAEYDQWRQQPIASQSGRSELKRDGTFLVKGLFKAHGNPRTSLALSMLAIYADLQAGDFFKKVDSIRGICGGFYLELDIGNLLMPTLNPVRSRC